MDVDGGEDLQQALALSMLVPACQCSPTCNAQSTTTLSQHEYTVQEHDGQDEPAPPPDIDMLTNDTVPPASQTPIAPNNHTPVQQQAPQAQQLPAAPHLGIQSNFFAAALAQAMAALPQQQGERWPHCLQASPSRQLTAT